MAANEETPSDQDEQANERNVEAGDTVRASWPVSLDTLRKNVSNSSAEAQELIVWCFLWCIDAAHPYRVQEFAARVGADTTTITRIIQGKYTNPNSQERMPISEKLTRAMDAFKKLEIERSQSKRSVFVLTPTAKRIQNACELARESQSPVFVVGPSHIGKTWALKNHTEDNNHGRTIYVRLQAASGLGGMVRAIAEACGISTKQPTARLVERLKHALKPNMLLILDEVHQLMYTYRKEAFFACLEVIREIYDAVGCGLVLCGTKLLLNHVRTNKDELEQLMRRGVHKIILPDMPTKGDVEAILREIGEIEFPARAMQVTVSVGGRPIVERPYEILRQVGKDEGLKAITERLRYGQKLASKAKASLSWEHFVRAHLIIKQNAIPESDWD